eukprot:gb/GEZN01006924.1/.p1 GENE.gb/GEZN01006924.1/~~gb/GEZN01006924.1/.p1  ORF type:complete len:488 (-),score=84.98 gb/GEZN01006924.1/:118-1581(-)
MKHGRDEGDEEEDEEGKTAQADSSTSSASGATSSEDNGHSDSDSKNTRRSKKSKRSHKTNGELHATTTGRHPRFSDVVDLNTHKNYGPRYDPDKIRERMEYVKKKHRPKLSITDWQRYDYYSGFQEYVKRIEVEVKESSRVWKREWILHRHHGKQRPVSIGLPVEHSADLTCERFIEEYEKPCCPLLIDGLADTWRGSQGWGVHELDQGPLRDSRLKVGEDDEGYSVKVRLKHFLQYMAENKDDSPLYLFDSSFDDYKDTRILLDEYEVPKYFRDDLFSLIGSKRRPPYRWWLIGPKRSGSTVHIDPLATSAWNTLIRGRKLWILMHPHALKAFVKGEDLREKGEDGEAITWFMKTVPRIKALEKLREAGPQLGIIEVIQEAGQTIYVPGGWWHAVVNLEDTCGVTQNYVSITNFPKVWRKTRKGRRKMASRWLAKLEEEYPQLAKQAKQMNEEDDWKMYVRDPNKPKKEKEKKDKKKKGGMTKGKE